MRNHHGQSMIEMAILFGLVAVVFIAMMRYIQSAQGGRIKATGDRLSPSLFDPERTTTTMNSLQRSYDESYANGFTASHARQASTSNRKQSF